ncbi:hypothetical protein C8F01DRAFT_1125697 [Mycena amicta]|nr:hypothetical protein C8F01DRAFT_1125697 [Mycena amicta]
MQTSPLTTTSAAFSADILSRQIGVPPLRMILSHLRSNATEPPPGVYRPFASDLQLQTFRRHLDVYLASFSPIRCLPEDILLQIFAQYAYSTSIDGNDKGSDLARAVGAPVQALSHVCAFWRAIILRTPTLWTFLDITAIHAAASKSKAVEETIADLVELSLVRSQGASLEIRSQRVSRGSLEILPVYLPSCKQLHITTLHHVEDMQYLATNAINNVPLLRSFRLALSAVPDPIRVNNTLAWMATAAELKNVSVSGTLIHAIPMPCLERLTSLTCTVYLSELNASVSVLSALPSSVHYSLVFYPTNFPSRPGALDAIRISETISQITRLTLAAGSLQKAHAMDQTTTVFGKVMSSLTLPNLQAISFEKAASNDIQAPLPLPWPHTEFLRLALRSSFVDHLLDLDLLGVSIALHELNDCLRTLVSLENLALSDRSQSSPLISTSLLRMLSVSQIPSNQQPLVPHLRILRLHSSLQFDDSALCDFLRSRATVKFTAHVYTLPGAWADTTDLRRWLIMEQVSDLRRAGSLALSFSAL